MDNTDKFLNWTLKLQNIAQNGLEYGNDCFDIERYAQIRLIATEMMAAKTGLPLKQVKEIFSSEDGYQTSKLATRAAIFKNKQILLVKETTDNCWSLPGGWCEPNLSVKDNCIKEAKEEAGCDIAIDYLIAMNDSQTTIHDKQRIKRLVNVCNVIFLCRELSSNFTPNIETSESAYFNLNNLPPLSQNKTNEDEIKMCFNAAQAGSSWQVRF